MNDSQMIEVEESLRLFYRLKRRYRTLTKYLHPDPAGLLACQRLNGAYAVLKGYLERLGRSKNHGKALGEIIRAGDQAVRDAIVMGWLTRTPRDGRRLRERIRYCCRQLELHPGIPDLSKLSQFYGELFETFLRITEWRAASLLPRSWNSARYFKNLALADRYLDLGLRSFYHTLENGRLEELSGIPLSFLEDALDSYRFLLPHSSDNMRENLETRMRLARIYLSRLPDPHIP